MFLVGEALPESNVGMPRQLEALRVGAGGSNPRADGVHWYLYKIRSSFGSMQRGSAAQRAVGTLSAGSMYAHLWTRCSAPPGPWPWSVGGANPPGSPGLRARRLLLLLDERVVSTGAHLLSNQAPVTLAHHVHLLTGPARLSLSRADTAGRLCAHHRRRCSRRRCRAPSPPPPSPPPGTAALATASTVAAG